MAKTNTIITIGRQFGSAGREIGRVVAKHLDIKLYDKEMLNRAAQESGLCKELFETHDEKPTNSFLYSLVMDTYSLGYSSGSYTDMPINHKVFLAQFDAIKKIADEGPCILVGRCADYVLKDYPGCINVFICASKEDRKNRVMDKYHLSERKATEKMKKIDRERKYYYETYSGKEWGSIQSHQILMNSSLLGKEKIVEYLAALYKEQQEE